MHILQMGVKGDIINERKFVGMNISKIDCWRKNEI